MDLIFELLPNLSAFVPNFSLSQPINQRNCRLVSFKITFIIIISTYKASTCIFRAFGGKNRTVQDSSKNYFLLIG